MFVAAPAISQDFYVGGHLGVAMIDDTASAAVSAGPLSPPEQISVNGLPFDTDETTYGIFVGWHARDWLAFEAGYSVLGNSGAALGAPAFLPVPLITPTIPPGPPSVGGFVSRPISTAFGPIAALDIEEWSIRAKFEKALTSHISANWSIGITRSEFDAAGALRISNLISLNPPVFEPVDIPFATPSSETGYVAGFGFQWDIDPRFSVDLGYRRHDTRVVVVDSVQLQLLVTL